MKLNASEKERHSYRPALGIAIVSLLICGLFFPLLITGLAQILMPYQADGEIVQLNGHDIGSNLIAQNFTSPALLHPRNHSASGVDPDITLQDAYSQLPRIHNATGISLGALKQVVDQNMEGTIWIFGNPYINVLRVNLFLVRMYPSIYR